MPELKIYKVVIPVVVLAPMEIEGGPTEDLVIDVPAYSKDQVRRALGKALSEILGTSLARAEAATRDRSVQSMRKP